MAAWRWSSEQPRRDTPCSISEKPKQDGRHWSGCWGDTLHPRAKEKPQQDSRRGKFAFRIKPHSLQSCSESSNKPCVHQDPGTPQRLRQNSVSTQSPFYPPQCPCHPVWASPSIPPHCSTYAVLYSVSWLRRGQLLFFFFFLKSEMILFYFFLKRYFQWISITELTALIFQHFIFFFFDKFNAFYCHTSFYCALL